MEDLEAHEGARKGHFLTPKAKDALFLVSPTAKSTVPAPIVPAPSLLPHQLEVISLSEPEHDNADAEQPAQPAQPAEPAEPACPARPQVVRDTGYFAEDWGMTMDQIDALMEECKADPGWRGTNSMYQMVEQYVIPKTKGTGVGYALMVNQAAPKRVNTMISHAWGENAEDFAATLRRSTAPGDVLFVCAWCIYQCEDGAGPSIKEQLGDDADNSPFNRVLTRIRLAGEQEGWAWTMRGLIKTIPIMLVIPCVLFFCLPIIVQGCVPGVGNPVWRCTQDSERSSSGIPGSTGSSSSLRGTSIDGKEVGTPWYYSQALGVVAFCTALLMYWLITVSSRIYNGRMIVVPNRECDLYSRLWCVFEVYAAVKDRVPIVLGRTLAPAGKGDSRNALCRDKHDEESIRGLIEKDVGYDKVDLTIAKVTRSAQLGAATSAVSSGLPMAIMTLSSVQLEEDYDLWWPYIIGMMLGYLPIMGIGMHIARRGVIIRGSVRTHEVFLGLLAMTVIGIAVYLVEEQIDLPAGCAADDPDCVTDDLHGGIVPSAEGLKVFLMGIVAQLQYTVISVFVLTLGVRVAHCFRDYRPVQLALKRHRISLAVLWVAYMLYLVPQQFHWAHAYSDFIRLVLEALKMFSPAALCCALSQPWGVQLESATSKSTSFASLSKLLPSRTSDVREVRDQDGAEMS